VVDARQHRGDRITWRRASSRRGCAIC
jgi:hypothetical protein